MTITRKLSVATAALAVAFSLAGAPQAAQAQDMKAAARACAAKSAKAVVTIKLVVKMKMMGQEEEQKIEVTGTMIDPSGLTVVSASEIDPSTMLKALMGGMGGRGRRGPGGMEMNFDSDVKETALILDDGTEIDADVVLKDADLDLAFIKPRDATQKFDAIALKKRDKAPQLLEEMFVLSRLGRLENRATALTTGYVKAVVKGPKTFYICDDEVSQKSLGCVAFDVTGAPMGVFVTKKNPDAESGAGGMGMLMGMLMGGRAKNAPTAAILRSCEDILEIAEQAKAAKAPEKKKAEDATTETKPTEDPKAGEHKPEEHKDGAKKDDKKEPVVK